jgi:hypothetical protein
MPLAFAGLSYRVFTLQTPRKQLMFPGILSWASTPLQRLPKHRAATLFKPLVSQKPELVAPPLRFLPLQRFPALGSGISWPGLLLPTACAFRFSQPPGALIRPKPAGLIPCRIRSWGHPPKLCSSRAAVHCFQRRSPLSVQTAFRVFTPRKSPLLDPAV